MTTIVLTNLLLGGLLLLSLFIWQFKSLLSTASTIVDLIYKLFGTLTRMMHFLWYSVLSALGATLLARILGFL